MQTLPRCLSRCLSQRRLPAPLLALVFTLSFTNEAPSQSTPRCYDFAPVDTLLSNAVASLRLRGTALLLEKDGVILYRKSITYPLNRVVSIASASKWIAGALVMSQVDDGKIKLDDPLSKYYGSGLPGNMGQATIRQCMSHTAGFDGRHTAVGNRFQTLAQAANAIIKTPLKYQPGSSFHYGGVSMHLVGRILEMVSNKSLEQLLQDRLGQPMGITSWDYQGLGQTRNYRFAGGLRSSLDDYATLLRMLVNGGRHQSTRILSTASIAEMFKDQTRNAAIVRTPQPDQRRYGIGIWRDRIDSQGRILQASSQGAFGFSPWIDFERNLAGTFLVANLLRRVVPTVNALQLWTRGNFEPAGVLCRGHSTRSCRGEIWLTASAAPVAGLARFTLSSRNAPPQTTGAILLAAAGRNSPVNLLGADLWIDLGSAVILPITSDQNGNSQLAFSLANVATGVRAAAQTAWVTTPSCGPPGRLVASWALDLQVR